MAKEYKDLVVGLDIGTAKVMAVVAEAPCQCFSPGENQMTSPGRISSMGPPHFCARPQPAVTMSV